MLVLRSLLFNIWLYASMIVMGVLGAPLALLSRDWAYRIMRAYRHMSFGALRILCGTRYEIRGTPPKGEVLVVAKHQSFADMMLAMIALERPKYVMKQSLKWAPVLGFYAMRIGATPVNRGAKGAAIKQMTAGLETARAEAGQIVIYLQGTRVPPGVKAPYKVGAGRIYQRFGVTAVPAATNTGVFWGRNTLRRFPGLMVLEFLEPIAPGMPLDDFMQEIETRVETASDALLKETPHGTL